jgi:diguanylate cyclase (GGDEF)-like protein
MDPLTALAIISVLVLMTGGLLALMNRDFPADLQPSARDWCAGAVVFAIGTALLAAQNLVPPAWVLPVANGCILLGYTLYWRAVRRFCGLHDVTWIFATTAAVVICVVFFTAISPNFAVRVVLVSAAIAGVSFGGAYTLLRHPPSHAAVSHKVLLWVFLLNGAVMAARSLYFAALQPAGSTVLDAHSWVTSVISVTGTFLPVLGTVAFLLLCTERVRRRWEYAASTDELTALMNRRTILSAGEASFAQARSANKPFSVGVVDVDHFKSVNDRFGHEAGDKALKHVAALLSANCRGLNKVGRLGGEEFVVLLPFADPFDAATAAERLRYALESTPLQLSALAEPLRLTASIGVASQTGADRDLSELLGRADRALYAAKGAGRNRVEVAVRELAA